MSINCIKCGLHIAGGNGLLCHLTGQPPVANNSNTCLSFIEIQMDGNEPFTPEQHLMMKQDWDDRQGMKKVRGMYL